MRQSRYNQSIMKQLCMLLALLLLVPFNAIAAEDHELVGLWLTKKRDAAVRIVSCQGELCGYISWLSNDEDQFSVSGKPLCQVQVLSGFKPDKKQSNTWTSGKVYKADDEKTYSGKITLISDDTVQLRAYLGIPALGKTKTLTRTSEKLHPPCKIPS